jgi:hypothetical protein
MHGVASIHVRAGRHKTQKIRVYSININFVGMYLSFKNNYPVSRLAADFGTIIGGGGGDSVYRCKLTPSIPHLPNGRKNSTFNIQNEWTSESGCSAILLSRQSLIPSSTYSLTHLLNSANKDKTVSGNPVETRCFASPHASLHASLQKSGGNTRNAFKQG